MSLSGKPTDDEIWVEIFPGSDWWGIKAHIGQKWATTVYHGSDPAWGQEYVGWVWI